EVDPVDQGADLGHAGVVGRQVDRTLGGAAGEATGTPHVDEVLAVLGLRGGGGRRRSGQGGNAHRLPGQAHRVGVLTCCCDGRGGEPREVGRGTDLAAGEGGVPDRAGPLPRTPTDRGGREVEGAVGDAGVEVHPTVVVVGVDVLVHRGALRVLAQPGVVVG